MSETLHFYLHDHGPVLANRGRGREVAERLRVLSEERHDLILDFEGVEAVTPPFIQELLGAIQFVGARQGGRLVLATNMNEDVAETFVLVLERRKQTLAYRRGDTVELLNELAPHLAEILREAQRLRRFTVTELAEQLDVKPNTLHGRLRPLLESGAIARERDADAQRGIRHRYRVVSTDEPSEDEADRPAHRTAADA
jgi:DNA-binding transcriptional ArsR family regulator